MTDENILEILKTDLQISAGAYDEYLRNVIGLARKAISDEGIKLDAGAEQDGMLVEQYAAYLYRKRKDEKAAMPRMLRYMLNNRLFRQKAGGG
ncbi:MAG: hypothetical protein K1W41_04040 [Lachnospiraceae bacterium]